jgi:pimeloyl-ACP methyl ester carboxylesterase
MADSSVLVPGTGGITLMDTNGNDLGYPVLMQIGVSTGGLIGRSAAELVELLSMAHAPGQIAPSRTSLVPGLGIRPGHALEVAYNQVPATVNRFLYDWRADVRYSAQQLLDYLRERKPATGRWNVVGHSQGGLLILIASKLLADPNEFAKYVRSVVLVGAPIAGTVNAAAALISGDVMGHDGEAAFRQITRTWPALYQMMPSWQAVVKPDGTAAPTQLLDAACWTGTPGISQDLLDRARAAQQMLTNPFANLGGDINLTVVMARTRATGNNLERPDTGMTAQSLAFELGDTLVPYQTTTTFLGADRKFVKPVTGPVREHAFLCDDPGVMNIVNQGMA